MRYILSVFLILLSFNTWAFSNAVQAVISATYSAGSGGTSSYFGFCGEGDTTCASTPAASPTYDSWENGDSGYMIKLNNASYVTCPGTGTKTVTAIKCFMKSTSGSGTGKNYYGLYDATLATAICYGSVTVSSSTASWLGGVTGSGLSGTCQCTGGTAYRIVFGPDSDDVNYARSEGYSSGVSGYVSAQASNIGYDLSSLSFTNDTNLYLCYVKVE